MKIIRTSTRIALSLFLFSFFVMPSLFAASDRWTVQSTLIKVIDMKTLLPGGSDFFSRFDPPNLYDGQVVFRGFTGYKKAGIYLFKKGSIQTLINNSLSPTGDRRTFFSFGASNDASVNDIPRVGKPGVTFFGNGFGNGLTGIYIIKDNRLLSLVSEKSVIPPGAKGLFTYFSSPAFIDKNDVAFIGFGEKGKSGIYRSTKQKNVDVIADTDTKAPEHSGNFVSFSSLAIAKNSASSEGAFVAMTEDRRIGIYGFSRNNFRSFIQDTTEISGGAGYFKSFENLLYDDDKGQVFFIGRGVLGQIGLYAVKNKLTKLVDQQTPVPETNETFENIRVASFDQGNIVFYGESANTAGLFLYSSKGVFKVLTLNDTVNEQPIDAIQISSDALSGNQVAVSLKFHNGDAALYILSLEEKTYS